MHIFRKGIDMSSWVYYICKLKGSHLEHRQYCLCKQFRVTLDLIIYSFICLCKVQKSGISRHQSSDFYLFSFIGFCCFCMVSCYVCGNSHSIQFMCSCVLYAITSTFSGKLIFKLKHENYWYRFASVQRTKPQLIPLPLLSSDTSMFPAQTRREDTREVMIFFNKKKTFFFFFITCTLDRLELDC